jgi:hypothetical protein
MSVRHEAVITCNQCGNSVTLPMKSSLTPYWNGPAGWLTIDGIGTHPMARMGTDTPEEMRNKRPDLCSWACVRRYAESKESGG